MPTTLELYGRSGPLGGRGSRAGRDRVTTVEGALACPDRLRMQMRQGLCCYQSNPHPLFCPPAGSGSRRTSTWGTWWTSGKSSCCPAPSSSTASHPSSRSVPLNAVPSIHRAHAMAMLTGYVVSCRVVWCQNPGCVMITDQRIYFQPAELNNVGLSIVHYNLSDIVQVRE
jgi:hypothetical protein